MKAFVLYLIRIYRALLPQWLRHLVPSNLRRSLHQRVRRTSLKRRGGKGRNKARKKLKRRRVTVLKHALPMLRKGKQDKALRIVNVFVKRAMKRPEKMTAEEYCICCEVLRRTLRYEDAVRLLALALTHFPGTPELWKQSALLARTLRDFDGSTKSWAKYAELKEDMLLPGDVVQIAGLHMAMHRHYVAHDLCEQALQKYPNNERVLISKALNMGKYVINYYNALHLEGNKEYADRIVFKFSSAEFFEAFSAAFHVCEPGKGRYEYLRELFVKSYCVARYSNFDGIKEFDSLLVDVVFPGKASRHAAIYLMCKEVLDTSVGHGNCAQTSVRDALKEDLTALDISSADLLHFERILLWSGLWEAASIVREKAAFLAIEQFERTQYTLGLEKLCLHAVEYAAPQVATFWLERLKESGVVSNSRFKGIEAYHNLLLGRLDSLRTFCEETLTPDERVLFGYLKGKSVAIVAPAPGEQLNGSEIESFDVVVRLNSLDNPSLERQERHGVRTDISAFNGTKVQILTSLSCGADIPLAQGVKFVLCKHQAGSFRGRDLVSVVRRDNRKDINRYVGESINHIPHLVYYLLGFSVSRIKIFNSNFFLSRNTHESSYGRAPVDLGSLVFSDSLDASHRLARRLLLQGLIEADEEASEVLSLDTIEYMSKMQALYVG